MLKKLYSQLLIDRKVLCEMLGNISVSHVIRLEHHGTLAKARVQVGPRMVRYDLREVKKLVDSKKLYM